MATLTYAARPLQGQALPAGPTTLVLDYVTPPEAVQWLVDGVVQAPTTPAAEIVLPIGSVLVRCRGKWAGRWTNHDARVTVTERPGPENTGPRVDLSAATVEAARTWSTPGEVITGRVFQGKNVVTAGGVVFVDCRFLRGPLDVTTALVHSSVPAGQPNVELVFCELDGQALSKTDVNADRAVRYSRLTLRHCDIHHLNDGVGGGDGSRVISTWVHDLQRQGTAHPDCIQITNAVDFQVLRSLLDCRGPMPTDGSARDLGNAAIMIGAETGTTDQVLVEGNWLAGGNYTVNVRDDPGLALVTLRGNTFLGGARYGAVLAPARVVQENNTTPAGMRSARTKAG